MLMWDCCQIQLKVFSSIGITERNYFPRYYLFLLHCVIQEMFILLRGTEWCFSLSSNIPRLVFLSSEHRELFIKHITSIRLPSSSPNTESTFMSGFPFNWLFLAAKRYDVEVCNPISQRGNRCLPLAWGVILRAPINWHLVTSDVEFKLDNCLIWENRWSSVHY